MLIEQQQRYCPYCNKFIFVEKRASYLAEEFGIIGKICSHFRFSFEPFLCPECGSRTRSPSYYDNISDDRYQIKVTRISSFFSLLFLGFVSVCFSVIFLIDLFLLIYYLKFDPYIIAFFLMSLIMWIFTISYYKTYKKFGKKPNKAKIIPFEKK